MACLILTLTASLVMWSLYEMSSSFLKHLISVACNFFIMSAVSVQVSQGYNSTEITRERISLIFELREICLSFQMVFSLALLGISSVSHNFLVNSSLFTVFCQMQGKQLLPLKGIRQSHNISEYKPDLLNTEL